MDEDYLGAFEYGMPPMADEGAGINCLATILADWPTILDVILFPLVRPRG